MHANFPSNNMAPPCSTPQDRTKGRKSPKVRASTSHRRAQEGDIDVPQPVPAYRGAPPPVAFRSFLEAQQQREARGPKLLPCFQQPWKWTGGSPGPLEGKLSSKTRLSASMNVGGRASIANRQMSKTSPQHWPCHLRELSHWKQSTRGQHVCGGFWTIL